MTTTFLEQFIMKMIVGATLVIEQEADQAQGTAFQDFQ
jgi:hypothetical protein